MNRFIIGTFLIFVCSLWIGASWEVEDGSTGQSIANILMEMGSDNPNKVNTSIPGVSAEVGYDIVHLGSSDRDGQKHSKRQSKHFVCTSCHNTVKEDPDLAVNDPQARLDYGIEHGIPFLQATTLYGVVNRTSFYNGDYEKKYGDLVKPARNDIRGAIQLCATECAQGRKLKAWELESVLAYLWTIDIKLEDLSLTQDETEMITAGKDPEKATMLIKSKYMDHSPAHFGLPPDDRKTGYGLEGDADNGQKIYDASCLHCHYHERYSFFNLDHSAMSLKYMARKAGTYSRHSLYQVIRYGTYPKNGKKSYMPHYTEEKLSNQQVEDLRAYFEKEAE